MSNSSSNPQLSFLIQRINIYYPIILSTLATIGNILSFIVFSSEVFRNNSSGFFLKFKTMADTLNVYLGTLRFTYLGVVESDVKETGVFMCYFITIGVYQIDSFCSWIGVLTSLDRFLIVIMPSKYSIVSKNRFPRCQISSIVITSVIITGINLQKIMQIYFYPENQQSKCLVINSFLFDMVNLVITVIIPFGLMLISSGIITRSLVISKLRLIRHRRTDRSGSAGIDDKSLSFIKTVLCLDVCFLVFNTPRFVIQILKGSSLQYILGLQLSTVVKYSYYALSILFYTASNSLFRAKLVDILKCLKFTPSRTNTDSTRIIPSRFSL